MSVQRISYELTDFGDNIIDIRSCKSSILQSSNYWCIQSRIRK